MKRLFLLLAACLALPFAYAAEWQQLTTSDGLFNNQTRQVICLPSGRMMVVVEGMINLYDGEQFQPLEIDRTLTTDVYNFQNRAYYLDRKGHLWIRTLHQLVAIDAHTLTPLNVRRMLDEMGIKGRLHNFFIDADGMVWLHLDGGKLLRYDWQSPAQPMLQLRDRDAAGMAVAICNITEVDGLHYILLSTGRMLCFDAKQRRTLYATELCDSEYGYTLMSYDIQSHDFLISLIQEGMNKVVRFDTRRRHLSETVWDGRLTDVMTDSEGRIWASDQKSIYRFDTQMHVQERISPPPFVINTFAVDRQGGLWACTTSQGLFYHSGVPTRLAYDILPGSTSADALLVQRGGSVLAGTSNGVFVQSRRYGEWKPVDKLQHLKVVHLDHASDGGIYISTMNHGLVMTDSLGNICWNIDESHSSQVRNRVEFCLPLSDGRCMINIRMNQLVVVDPQTLGTKNLMRHLGEDMLHYRRIIDALPLDGGWLMGTQNGLFYLKKKGEDYELDTQRFARLADNPWTVKCNCLFQANDGSIFVGTQNGLLRYRESNDELRRYTTREGLPHNTVLSIVDDHRGRLWMATMQGLSCLDLATDEAISFGRTDGVTDQEFVERAAVRTADGHLLFGTRQGVYTINPDSLQLPRLHLTPQLLTLHIAGQDVPITGTDSFSLPHDHNFLTFIFSTLNYAYADHTRFCYQLKGIDPGWTIVTGKGDKLELSYTALPPGHYRLGVKAALQGEAWGETLWLDIVIRPPLWRMWWAYLIYIIVIVALVWYFLHTYQSQRQMRLRIDELLRERERPVPSVASSETVVETEAETSAESSVEPQEELQQAEASLPPKEISPADRRFLEKALSCIDRNMANTEYSIEAFASDMAMERSTLYRRLQSVMGQGPLEFVRTIRLKHAAELLRSGRYSVTEVSELVGYNTPRYFAKHFREMYGVRPGEYR